MAFEHGVACGRMGDLHFNQGARTMTDKPLFEALTACAKVLRNTLNELEHWHGWRTSTSPEYADSDGFRICQGRIERARTALTKLDTVIKEK
jgi:hypothetical protein